MGKRRETEFIVRGVLRDAQGRVLLCRNTKGGYLYLPGGHVEFGEPAGIALAREFKEETGLRVRCGDFLLASEVAFGRGGSMIHEINLVFHTELFKAGKVVDPPARVASKERKIAFDWVSTTELAEMDVRPRALAAWLARDEPSSKSQWLSEIAGGGKS